MQDGEGPGKPITGWVGEREVSIEDGAAEPGSAADASRQSADDLTWAPDQGGSGQTAEPRLD
jgi:hypothetical protein